MAKVEMYSSFWCPYCARAKKLLEQKGVAITEIDVDMDADKVKEMRQRSGRRSVPQIFIDGHHVGGCDDLYALERAGKLDPLLRPTA